MKRIYTLITLCLIGLMVYAQNNRWDNQFITSNSPDDSVFTIKTTGNEIYIGGAFHNVAGINTNHIAHYDGSSWMALGTGTNGHVYTMCGYNSNLIAGGNFSTAGGISAQNIALWNGTTWTNIGGACNGTIRTIVEHDQYLYVGGDFTTIGGIVANHIARFNGTSWETVGDGTNGPVYSIHMGASLFVGGSFTIAGSLAVNNIASWNGTSWQAMGSGFDGHVYSITGAGVQITAAGSFTQSGTTILNNIGKWNGGQWLSLNNGTNNKINCIEQAGPFLYASGNFTIAGTTNTNYIAQWDGTNWSSLGNGLNHEGFCLDNNSNDLYCGGAFTTAGLSDSYFIAKYLSPPTILQQSSSISKCTGDSLMLIVSAQSSTPITYQWEKDGVPVSLSNDTLIVYPLQTIDGGTYTCALTNSVGTANMQPVLIMVNEPPFYPVSTFDTSVCAGTQLVLYHNVSGTNPLYFQWYYNNTILPGEINDTLKFNSILTNNSGNYFILAQNMCGDDSIFYNVMIHNNPTVSFSGLSAEYCINNSIDTLTGIPAGGTFSGSGINANLFNPSGLVGNHNITYTYSDANGCVGNNVQTTLIHTLPAVSFTGLSASYCFNSSSDTMHVSPLGGIFYGSGMTDSLFNPGNAGSGSVNIYYSYTDLNGCTNTKSQTTLIYAEQIFSYPNLDSSFCNDDNSYSITVNPVGGVFSGTGISGNDFSPNSAGIGIHEIVYHFTDFHGCINADTLHFSVNPVPNVSISSLNANYCKNANPDTIIGTPSGGIFSGFNIANEVLNPSDFAPGNHNIFYTYTNNSGCTNTDTATFTITNAITVFFTGISTFYCENELPDSLIGIPAGGTFSGPGVIGNYFTPTLAGSGISTITYSYDNMNGCMSYDSVSITVAPLPNINIGQDTAICMGTAISLSAISDSGSVFWSTNETSQSILVNPNQSTIYWALITNSTCQNKDSVTITVNPIPDFDLGQAITACPPLTLHGPTQFSSYLWSDNSTDSLLLVSASGIYSLAATNEYNCTSTDFVTVNILASPHVDLGHDMTISSTQSIIIGSAPNFESYEWNTGSLNNSIIISGSDYSEGIYPFWLTASNSNGCSATDSIFITILGDVGISEGLSSPDFAIFPNPTNSYINLAFQGHEYSSSYFNILSVTGKIIFTISAKEIIDNLGRIDLTELADGIYFIQQIGSNNINVHKFIKN